MNIKLIYIPNLQKKRVLSTKNCPCVELVFEGFREAACFARISRLFHSLAVPDEHKPALYHYNTLRKVL